MNERVLEMIEEAEAALDRKVGDIELSEEEMMESEKRAEVKERKEWDDVVELVRGWEGSEKDEGGRGK